jgi:alpha-mannosidase
VVDLLERPVADGVVPVEADGGVRVSLRPFQVLTLRLSS